MLCPVCRTELKIADRQGVEIDYCPKCRGVWLDRGELEKLIERVASYEDGATRTTDVRRDRVTTDFPETNTSPRYRERDDYDDSREPRRKKGFLGDVFDIFD